MPSGNIATFSVDRIALETSVGNFTIANIPEGIPRVFGLSARDINQDTGETCEDFVGGVDDFCNTYLAEGPAAEDDVVQLALDAAADNGIPEILFSAIEDLVREFFEVLTSQVAATVGSYVFDDRVAHEDRIFNHFYFSGGMYKSFDATRPSSTAYMMTAQDSDGNELDAYKS